MRKTEVAIMAMAPTTTKLIPTISVVRFQEETAEIWANAVNNIRKYLAIFLSFESFLSTRENRIVYQCFNA